jgi:23S rRNA (cytosine1962-C5)-methyltransferase
MGNSLHLKPGREKSVLSRHPWIFSGAVDRIGGNPQIGESVDIFSAKNEWLARAAYSPFSSIRARIWTWDVDEQVNKDLFIKKIKDASAYRDMVVDKNRTDAYRIVYGESDGLPGLVVDLYRDWLVVQFLSAGCDYWKDEITQALIETTGVKNIFERSDVDVRNLEGLDLRIGNVAGIDPPERLVIKENGLSFWVSLASGQKTGFYLDQRANRQRVYDFVQDKRVLNCFCYTGAFTVYALKGGARELTSIDSSADALMYAQSNLLINDLSDRNAIWQEADVFKELRTLRDRNEKFDVIILDPPKFAPTIAQAERAARGYKDINLLAFKLLNPNGFLFTFSCSGGVSADLFQKIVIGAALDAKVNARIIAHLEQSPDHPVSLTFPEGAYLKGLILQSQPL